MSESDFPQISYAARGGAPKVDVRLSVAPDGSATLYVGTSDSLPGVEIDEVGFFRGTISAADRRALLDLIAANDLVEALRDREAVSPDPVTGYLTLAGDDRTQRLVFAQIEDLPAAVEATQMMNNWMVTLLDAPWKTAQTELAVDVDGDQMNLRLTLTNRGTERLPMILFSERMASQFLKMELSFFAAADKERVNPLATAGLERETVAGFVADGAFAPGWHDLPPGQPLVLELPPLTDFPGGELQLETNFLFWLPGDGLEERLAIVRPPVVSIGGSE